MAKDDKVLTLPNKGYRLTVPRLQDQDVGQKRWVANIETGVPYEAVLKPAFWAHVAHKFTKFDTIAVRAEDGAYYAELLVVVPLKADTVVKELVHVELEIVREPGTEMDVGEFKVSFHGPTVKWRVSRDKRVMRDGFNSSAEAIQWAKDYSKASGKVA